MKNSVSKGEEDVRSKTDRKVFIIYIKKIKISVLRAQLKTEEWDISFGCTELRQPQSRL